MNRTSIQSLRTHSSLPDERTENEDKEELNEPNIDYERVRRFATDTDLRKLITYCFIINITFWMYGVMSVLYFNNYLLQLHLSDKVLITLLTTTTLNVIGMMTIILKNLFPIQAERVPSQPVLCYN